MTILSIVHGVYSQRWGLGTLLFALMVSGGGALASPQSLAPASAPLASPQSLSPAPAASPQPLSPAPAPAADQGTVDISGITAVDTDSYLLGPGDRVLVDIFDVPEHSGERQVLIDGSVNLNWVGGVSVQGMTLPQAASAIATAYNRYLYDPLVTVTLTSPRPLRVSVAGAVNRPGSYVVSFTEAPGSDPDARWPTVTQALQQAGGITQFANVRQVQVERQQSVNTTDQLNLDLWALIQTGDLSQDLALRDGDSIYVPATTAIDPTEAQDLASASFSPAVIQVNVVGEVTRPGTVEVPPNTPLNQALLAAGGFDNSRAATGAIQLVRLNPDGSVSQREVAVDFTQGINEQTNPILYANDVIIVNRSGTAQFSDTLDGVLETIGKLFPFFVF